MSDRLRTRLRLWDVQTICLISTAAAEFLIVELVGTMEVTVGIHATQNLNSRR